MNGGRLAGQAATPAARPIRRQLLLRRAGVLRRPQSSPVGRPHVALRGGRQRGHRRGGARRDAARRGARRPHRRPRSRAAAGPARGGGDHRSLSGDRRNPGLAPAHPGDLHAVRNRGRLRARHPHPDRRGGPGHDGLPLRPGAGRRALAGATRRRGIHRRRDRARAEGRPGRHPQPARHRVAAPRPPGGSGARRRRARPPAHRRAVDELRDLRADEALRRGRGGREGPPQPTLRGGLRAGDGASRRRGLPAAS